jgi:hypothetical protein
MLNKHKKPIYTIEGWDRSKVEITEEPPAKDEPAERSMPELITKARTAFEKMLGKQELKPTLAEYLKLLQVEKEFAQEAEGIREITARWVEPEGEYSEE